MFDNSHFKNNLIAPHICRCFSTQMRHYDSMGRCCCFSVRTLWFHLFVCWLCSLQLCLTFQMLNVHTSSYFEFTKWLIKSHICFLCLRRRYYICTSTTYIHICTYQILYVNCSVFIMISMIIIVIRLQDINKHGEMSSCNLNLVINMCLTIYINIAVVPCLYQKIHYDTPR